MKTSSIIFSIVFVVLIGCEKEKCKTLYPNNLIIGKLDHCQVQYIVYNPWIIIKAGTDGSPLSISFDLTMDGNPEFQLSSDYNKDRNDKRSQIADMSESMELIVDIIPDSVFNCIGHLNEFGTTLPISYTASTGYQCSNPEADYLEGVYPIKIPTQFSFDDTLFVENHNDYNWYGSGSFSLLIKGPVDVYGKDWFIYFLRESWNNQGPKYLCFRVNLINEQLKKQDVNKYGWLKIEIIDYYEIRLYESAIQN